MFKITRANSKTAKLLAENIVEKNYKGKFVKVGIAEDSVEKIKLKNYTMPAIVPIVTWVNIIVGIVIVTSLVLG